MEDENSIFDKILAGDLPCDKVYEDDDVLAFRDIHPVARTHVLVIPKVKVKSFSELHALDDHQIGRYMKKIALVAKELGLQDGGYRIVFNTGVNGGQTVPYIHAHLLGGQKLAGFS